MSKTKVAPPSFVSSVGDKHASGIQLSFLIHGKVTTFAEPLLSLEMADVAATIERIKKQASDAVKIGVAKPEAAKPKTKGQ